MTVRLVNLTIQTRRGSILDSAIMISKSTSSSFFIRSPRSSESANVALWRGANIQSNPIHSNPLFSQALWPSPASCGPRANATPTQTRPPSTRARSPSSSRSGGACLLINDSSSLSRSGGARLLINDSLDHPITCQPVSDQRRQPLLGVQLATHRD